MTYAEKLKDPRWQSVRFRIITRDNHKCRKCNSTESLQVHHTIYFNFRDPWNYEDEYLITLCKYCHEEVEQWLNTIKIFLSYIQRQEIWKLDNIRVLLQRELTHENYINYISTHKQDGKEKNDQKLDPLRKDQ